MDESIRVAVASHKPYWIPSDSVYLPIHVGAALSNKAIDGFQRDDEGDSISELNPKYCELTALYWLWRNIDSDYKGLVHYRRYFKGKGERDVACQEDIEQLLAQAPIVLPKKRYYYISSVEQHYADTFDQTHIEALRKALSAYSPEVLPAFESHMKSRKAHIWNMCIMRSDIYDEWCSWLFPLLQIVEQEIIVSGMTPFQMRVIGRLSERLLDPWIEARGYQYVECEVASMEKVKWAKKIFSFLMAKIGLKKYESSF